MAQAVIFKIADGGKKEWIGDGFCDDMNNQEMCDFDGGDCCGAFTRNHFCIKCGCIRKLILGIIYSELPNKCKVFFQKLLLKSC